MCIPPVVNGQQLWLHVLRNQYSVYHTAKSIDHVVCKICMFNMNLVVFHWWGHHYKQFILRHVGKLCFSRAQQQQSYSPTWRWAYSFCSYCLCLNVNFPGQWIGRGETIAWPSRSPDVVPLDYFLWGHMKDHVYSQTVNTLYELKAQITAAIANVTVRLAGGGL
jgi:hypothetical protein